MHDCGNCLTVIRLSRENGDLVRKSLPFCRRQHLRLRERLDLFHFHKRHRPLGCFSGKSAKESVTAALVTGQSQLVLREPHRMRTSLVFRRKRCIQFLLRPALSAPCPATLIIVNCGAPRLLELEQLLLIRLKGLDMVEDLGLGLLLLVEKRRKVIDRRHLEAQDVVLHLLRYQVVAK